MRHQILDLIYPPVCELCKSGLERGSALCQTCQDSLPKIREPFCQNCGEVFDGNLPDDFSCPNCQGLALDFDFARASLQGREQAFELIHLLKYHRRFYLARNLARYLEDTRQEDERRILELRPTAAIADWSDDEVAELRQSLEQVAKRRASGFAIPVQEVA